MQSQPIDLNSLLSSATPALTASASSSAASGAGDDFAATLDRMIGTSNARGSVAGPNRGGETASTPLADAPPSDKKDKEESAADLVATLVAQLFGATLGASGSAIPPPTPNGSSIDGGNERPRAVDRSATLPAPAAASDRAPIVLSASERARLTRLVGDAIERALRTATTGSGPSMVSGGAQAAVTQKTVSSDLASAGDSQAEGGASPTSSTATSASARPDMTTDVDRLLDAVATAVRGVAERTESPPSEPRRPSAGEDSTGGAAVEGALRQAGQTTANAGTDSVVRTTAASLLAALRELGQATGLAPTGIILARTSPPVAGTGTAPTDRSRAVALPNDAQDLATRIADRAITALVTPAGQASEPPRRSGEALLAAPEIATSGTRAAIRDLHQADSIVAPTQSVEVAATAPETPTSAVPEQPEPANPPAPAYATGPTLSGAAVSAVAPAGGHPGIGADRGERDRASSVEATSTTVAPAAGPPRASELVPGAPTNTATSATTAAQLVEQIANRVHLMTTRGQSELRFQLHPESLGPLDVRINVDSNGVSVHLGTSAGDVQGLIQSSIGDLKTALQQQGVRADRFVVVVNQGLAPDTQGAGSGGSRGQGGGRRPRRYAADIAGIGTGSAAAARTADVAGIDYLA